MPLPSPTPSTPNPTLPPHITAVPRPIILALSGPSSSGKTTLATVLATLLPQCHILHLDDFYLPERQLPHRAGMPDWDSAASFDLDALRIRCERWKAGEGMGVVESGVVGKGGGEAGGEAGGGEGTKEEGEGEDWTGDGVHGGTMPAEGTTARERLARVVARLKLSPLALSGGWGGGVPPSPSPSPSSPDLTTPRHRLLILDGILLHTPAFAALQPLFDIKILLRASFAEAQRRREARGGYVTLEGFWQDPAGYFEEVVWRSYQEGHGGFFQDGDVEGVLRTDGEGDGGGNVEGAVRRREGEGEVGDTMRGQLNENKTQNPELEPRGVPGSSNSSSSRSRSRSSCSNAAAAAAACVINDVWVQPLGMDLAQGLEWVWAVLERAIMGMEGGGGGG